MLTHSHISRRTHTALLAALAVSALAGVGAAGAHTQTTVVVAENGAGNGAVSTFALGAGSTPIRRITGSLTGLSSPEQIAADRSGNLYVATSSGSITVYAPTATGNVAPVRKIAGAATKLGGGEFGIAVDAAGEAYASNHYLNSITEYAPGANGNAAPIATAGPQVNSSSVIDPEVPGGVQRDSQRLFDAGGGTGTTSLSDRRRVPSGARGELRPIAALRSDRDRHDLDHDRPRHRARGLCRQRRQRDGDELCHRRLGQPGAADDVRENGFRSRSPAGIAIAPSGRVYFANSGNDSVMGYPPGAAAMFVTDLTGAATGLQGPSAVALDAAGRLYVADEPANVITVYAAGANGNASSVATISGPDTGVSGPDALAIDSAGRLWVADSGSNSLTQYATGANGDAKPLATTAGSATGLNRPRGLARTERHRRGCV